MKLKNAPVENLDWAPVPSSKGILPKQPFIGTSKRMHRAIRCVKGGCKAGSPPHMPYFYASPGSMSIHYDLGSAVQRLKRNLFKHSRNVYNNASEYTWEAKMRTNVVIDDDLMESALKLSGLKTKKDAIEEGL